MPDLASYDRPSVAIDLAMMTVADGQLKVLLTKRDQSDVPGFAMPGGFVRINDGLDATVERVMAQKVGIDTAHFEQLATYGAVDRDPRGRVISVVYLALCPAAELRGIATDHRVLADVVVEWPGETGGPAMAQVDGAALPLAFDHADILGDVVKRLRGKLEYSAIAFSLLPDAFTLRAVQEVHEAILASPLTKPPFRRKLLDRGLIEPTGDSETSGAHRPAALYQLKPKED